MCSAYETGSKSMSAAVSRWKAPGCSGNPFTTSWKSTSKSLLSMRSISKRYLGEKRMSKTPNGRARKVLCAVLREESRVERSRVINELTGDGNITKEHSMFVKHQIWKSAYRW